MRSWKFAALVAAAASVVLGTSAVPGASAATPATDWPQYMDNTFHSSTRHEGAITTAAGGSLHSGWDPPPGKRGGARGPGGGGRGHGGGRGAGGYAGEPPTRAP